MKFKIIKEVCRDGTWYWTVPKGFFNKLIHCWNPFIIHYEVTAYDCWQSLEKAKQHIERWNSGYYKMIYYKAEVL